MYHFTIDNQNKQTSNFKGISYKRRYLSHPFNKTNLMSYKSHFTFIVRYYMNAYMANWPSV